MLTYAEIYRIQAIQDNLTGIIKITEKSRKEKLDNLEKYKLQNLLANTTVEFYLIAEGIKERELNKGAVTC